MQRRRVDFPDPDFPSNATISMDRLQLASVARLLGRERADAVERPVRTFRLPGDETLFDEFAEDDGGGRRFETDDRRGHLNEGGGRGSADWTGGRDANSRFLLAR